MVDAPAPSMGFGAQIAPELRVFERPIDDFQPYPDNPRRHRIDKIAASLQKHQQRSPIVVQRGTGFILKGNGTWQAAKRLGWTSIAALIIDADETEAAAYLADDNLTSDLASNDAKALAKVLARLGPDQQQSIFSMDEIADVVEQANGLVDIEGVTDAAYLGDRPGEEEAEARRATKTGAAKMKEAPLTFTMVDHAVFAESVKTLGKAWSLKSTAHVCLEALRRCVAAEMAGGEAAGVEPLVGPVPAAQVEGQTGMAEMLDSADERPGGTMSGPGTFVVGEVEPERVRPVVSPLRESTLVPNMAARPWVLIDPNGEVGAVHHRLNPADQRRALCGKSTRDGDWITDPSYADLPLCPECAAAEAPAS